MSIALCMVMLRDTVPIPKAETMERMKKLWPDLPDIQETKDDEEGADDSASVCSFNVGEISVLIAEMPAPIPWSDLQGPCETSILWKNAKEEVPTHTSHWLITLFGNQEPIEQMKLLTQAAAAVMSATPAAMGVFWGSASMVIPKPLFVEFAEKILPKGPPIPMWVDFRVGKDAAKTSAGFTTGMRALGLMEFEAKGATESPGELRQRFESMAMYLLENGPVIKDGDTVGEDANEKIRVIYSKSEFGHKEQVMRLVYENQKKPWFKIW